MVNFWMLSLSLVSYRSNMSNLKSRNSIQFLKDLRLNLGLYSPQSLSPRSVVLGGSPPFFWPLALVFRVVEVAGMLSKQSPAIPVKYCMLLELAPATC